MFEKACVNKFDRKTFWWRNCTHWKKHKNLETSRTSGPLQGKTFWSCNFHFFLCSSITYFIACIDIFSSVVRFHLFSSLILSIYVAFFIHLSSQETSKKIKHSFTGTGTICRSKQAALYYIFMNESTKTSVWNLRILEKILIFINLEFH